MQLINDAYNLVVDALLGPETELGAAEEPFTSIMLTLRGVKIPIASLDIPSGLILLLFFYLVSSRTIGTFAKEDFKKGYGKKLAYSHTENMTNLTFHFSKFLKIII